MAKKPKTIAVKGLSIDDIVNMDINTLGEADLRAVATRMVSAANKRIRRLEKAEYGKLSPAYGRIKNQGRMFSVKGKNMSQLRGEMAQMRSFIRLKTSTLSGWRKVRKYVEKRLGGTMSESDTIEFWRVYRKLEQESGGSINALYDSDKIQKMLHSEMSSGGSEEDLLERMLDNMDAEYEKMTKQEDDDNENETIGDIFDIKGVF